MIIRNSKLLRVLLVNLNFQGQIRSVAQTSVGPPMGLAYIGAVLKKRGVRVEILDANALNLGWKQIRKKIERFRPHLVGTTAATPTIHAAGKLAELAKSVDSRIRTVVGGPHVFALPVQTLEEFPAIDIGVIGEAELLIGDLVELAVGSESLESVPGTVWRRGEEVKFNSGTNIVENLDDLPFPARELLPNRLYRTVDAWPMTCIVAMRGCPAGCTYCNVPRIFGRKVRVRSPANVVAEIEECYLRYRIRFFSFLDDTFTCRRDWVLQLCELLQSGGLARRVKWSCLTRPDFVDKELLMQMRNAGCFRIEFGIETGSERMLKFLRKGVKLEQIRYAFALAKEVGLVTLGFVMTNIPGETPKDFELTRAEVFAVEPDLLQLSFCTPYPGTDLYDYCASRGLITTFDWSRWVFLTTPVCRNPAMPQEKVVSNFKKLVRDFYLRPYTLIKAVRYVRLRPQAVLSLTYTAGLSLKQLLWCKG